MLARTNIYSKYTCVLSKADASDFIAFSMVIAFGILLKLKITK